MFPSRLPEEEPSGLKHVEDIVKIKILLILFCGVQKNPTIPIDGIRLLFHRKKYNPLLLPCSLCPT